MTTLNKPVKTYWCNNSMKFNLDSMYTHLEVARDELRDNEIEYVYICGKKYDLDNIDDLIDEVGDLLSKALYTKVTGREYGRIKQLCEERKLIRYTTCLAHGMSEEDAGYAFMD